MSFIYWPFAWIMKGCLFISGQYYLVALLFFALAMKLLLLPLAIKQQKSQIENASFAPKEMAIRKKYAGRNDKATQQKMLTEIQEAKQNAGISLTAGCMPMILQLVLVIILYAIVRAPITYSFNFESQEQYDLYKQSIELIQEYKDAADPDSENYEAFITELTQLQTKLGGVSSAETDEEKAAKNQTYHIDEKYSADTLPSGYEYDLAKMLKDPDALQKIADSHGVVLTKTEFDNVIDPAYGERLPNFDFIDGTSLLDTPNITAFNWLLLIPLLVFASQFFSTRITRKLSPQQLDANGKPVGGGLFMELGMPLISTIFSFNFSAAIGVYWVWQTLIIILQSVILAKAMPLPVFTPEQYAEAERELKAKTKKKKRITIEVDEDDDSFSSYQVVDDNAPATGGNNGRYTYDQKVEMLSGDDIDDSDDGSSGEML